MKFNKILFVSSRLNKDKKNGAYVVSNRNLKILENIFNKKNIEIFEIKEKRKLLNNINQVLFKRIEEIDERDEKKIIETIQNKKINIVFFDTSSYGFLCEKIKKYFPDIKNIVFCHDINYFLFKSIFAANKNYLKKIKQNLLLKNAEINEIKSFTNADIILTLNLRDSKLLKQKYNINANIEIPVSLEYKELKEVKNKFQIIDFNLLFVGVGNFSPNIQGLEFFIMKVLPYINAKLYIVGKNMEKYKQKFEQLDSKVSVIGTVDKLDDYYNSADAIIAPIFSGGGMKVKTAEALMYGKIVFGTNEAFEGYEIDYNQVGGLCNTPKEYIEKINIKILEKYQGNFNNFNNYSRILFLEKYSYNASEKIFRKILKELN